MSSKQAKQLHSRALHVYFMTPYRCSELLKPIPNDSDLSLKAWKSNLAARRNGAARGTVSSTLRSPPDRCRIPSAHSAYLIPIITAWNDEICVDPL